MCCSTKNDFHKTCSCSGNGMGILLLSKKRRVKIIEEKIEMLKEKQKDLEELINEIKNEK